MRTFIHGALNLGLLATCLYWVLYLTGDYHWAIAVGAGLGFIGARPLVKK